MTTTPKTTPPPEGYVDVLWAVRVPANSPIEGASFARVMQFDPASVASVYEVRDPSGNCQVIDLQNTAPNLH